MVVMYSAGPLAPVVQLDWICRARWTKGASLNIDQLRQETPGCEHRVHLNNAGSSLMPNPVLNAIQNHLVLESEVGGYEAEDLKKDAIHRAYQSVASLIGTQPKQIALTENATASYIQALSSISWAAGDVILTTRNDYVSNQIHFLSMQKRLGVRVLRVPDKSSGGVDVTEMEEMIRRLRPRVVCVSHIPTNSGLVQDVASVGAICRAEEVLFLVDACQSVGQMPINVDEMGCDFMSATARKFLRGPRGAGFLYVSVRALEMGLEPLFIDMRGAEWVDADRYETVDDARRFENWEFAWALMLGMGKAARYATDIGIEAIRDRVQSLAHLLRTSLSDDRRLKVLDRGSELCGIVSVAIEGHDVHEMVAALRERKINSTGQVRIYAVLDFDDKNVQSTLRLSPHYFNTEAEVELAAATIKELVD